jgi:hypothetical protein
MMRCLLYEMRVWAEWNLVGVSSGVIPMWGTAESLITFVIEIIVKVEDNPVH